MLHDETLMLARALGQRKGKDAVRAMSARALDQLKGKVRSARAFKNGLIDEVGS